MSTRRLVYLGTPDIAVPPLRALHDAGHDIALVVSQPDRRRGRGSALMPSPVKAAAVELGIPVSDRVDDVLDAGADLGVVVAFGRLIKPHVLAALPMINVHFSLLPRWRGAAPLERAIIAGDTVTGVCIIDVVEQLDAGDVYAREEVPIGDTTTAEQLREVLVGVATGLLLDVLDGDLPEPQPQVGDVTYAEKFSADDWRLDWNERAVVVNRWIRAGHAWTTFRGRRLRVLAAELVDAVDVGSAVPGALADDGETVGTASGGVRMLRVQPEGKAPMTWPDFANGAHPEPGERFT